MAVWVIQTLMQHWPDVEVGGTLFGNWDTHEIVGVIQVDNVAIDPTREYVPSLLQWNKASKDYIYSFLGGFHSHPHGPPDPSPADLIVAETTGLLLICTPGRWALLHPPRHGFEELPFRFT